MYGSIGDTRRNRRMRLMGICIPLHAVDSGGSALSYLVGTIIVLTVLWALKKSLE